MATHFTAVINHNLDEHDLHTLPDLLNSTWRTVEPFLPIIEGYPVPGYSPAKWQWTEYDGGFSLERLHRNGAIPIDSHEFGGGAGERVFSVYHAVRWWSFLDEQTVRDKLRRVCRHIASVFGSDQIIYLPSAFLKPEGAISLMHEGKAVEDMIEWLLENCGPPIQDVESIYRGDLKSWDANGYYVEKL
jgi:hypothetical protein